MTEENICIISKKNKRQIFRGKEKIIDIYQKKKRAKDRARRDPTFNFLVWRGMIDHVTR